MTALAFSPGGRTLVSAGRDGTLKVWNLAAIAEDLATYGFGWEFPNGTPWDEAAIAEKKARREAAALRAPLRDSRITKPELLDALRRNDQIPEPVRLLALKEAEKWQENAWSLDGRAWTSVRKRGLRLVDHAATLPATREGERPTTFPTTRGAAFYRLGRFEEAVRTLDGMKDNFFAAVIPRCC